MNSEFIIGQGAGHKLELAFRRANEGNALLEWLSTGDNLRQVGRLYCGEAELVLKEKPVPAPEVAIDTIIRVDRSIHPSYPEWVKTVMHPELENVGLAEYDVTKTEQWLHDGQKNGKIEGERVYSYLKDTGDLKKHLGLRDLEEIQKRGLNFFRKHFAGKAVFAWQGVVRDRYGHFRAPCLCEFCDWVVLRWDCLDDCWDGRNPGLRHAS